MLHLACPKIVNILLLDHVQEVPEEKFQDTGVVVLIQRVLQGIETHIDRDLDPETNPKEKVIMMSNIGKGNKVENIKIKTEADILVVVERKKYLKKRKHQKVQKGGIFL